MGDRFSHGALAIIIAFAIAGLSLGTLLLRNWLAYKVVGEALKQPAYAFPTSQVQYPYGITPFAISTPAFDPSLWNYSFATPTPEQSGVIIVNP